ncbi:cytidylyltransferase domain-containing protein [Mucilaginibacter sp. AW1-7]
MKLGKVIAHIPAKGGSKRVQSKNLRYMDGKAMIAYSIESALNSNLDEVM